jgi:hypothetical protein
MGASDSPKWSTLTLRTETYEAVKSMKRGGETYQELMGKMLEQYDPDEAWDDPRGAHDR